MGALFFFCLSSFTFRLLKCFKIGGCAWLCYLTLGVARGFEEGSSQYIRWHPQIGALVFIPEIREEKKDELTTYSRRPPLQPHPFCGILSRPGCPSPSRKGIHAPQPYPTPPVSLETQVTPNRLLKVC